MSANITLQDCFKSYTLDQDKAVSPEETVVRVREKLAAAGLDVLRNTERIDNGRLDIPVYVSVCGDDAIHVMPTKKQMGKGASPAQAEASAVMEMVERFSFFHFMKNAPFVTATYEEVKDRAMPFEQIAAAVHHDPEDFERAESVFSELRMNWIPALNLTRDREYLVPFDWFYEINEFNGPAAGNRIEEAIAQGLSELIERHVSALICRNRMDVPTIDLDSLKTEPARELVEKFRKAGVEVWAKDFTLDMGVPTVGALAYDPSTFPESSEIVYTAGTASDPEKAFIRALTEVAQLGGDFNTRANFVASGLPKYTDMSQAEYVTKSSRTTPIADLPNICDDNIRAEVESAVKAMADKGYEVYVINVTHPGIQAPAVYTIMPGAHFRERAKGSSVPFFAAKLTTGNGTTPEYVEEQLAKIGRIYPGTYYIPFYEGQMLIEEERPEEAVLKLESALKHDAPDEDLAGILTYLGLARKNLEQYDLAIDVLSRSATVDPERRDTFNLLGFCHFKTQRHEEAIEAFKKVLEIDPGSGIDYANIGANYRAMDQKEKALAYFKTALELDPALTWVWGLMEELLEE